MSDFLMPSLGADMDEGILVEWTRHPGDTLKRGDVVAVVETQKGAIEIEVFRDGVLEAVHAAPGARLPVGALLATIREPGEAAATAPIAPAPAPPAAPAIPISMMAAAKADSGKHRAVTPAARQRAAAAGIDLTAVPPGSDGIIGLREVAAAGATRPRAAGINLQEMRKAIAAAMARSKREIPHYYVASTIDMTPVADWLAAENARRTPPERILSAAAILKAVALALRNAPELNGHMIDGTFHRSEEIKMGVGIAMRGGGLIAPALTRPDAMRIDEVMTQLNDLVARVRGGRLRSSELMEATVTLSNLGDDSADMLHPVIYPPQVAIIGVGRMSERVWAVDGKAAIRKLAVFTVAGDHRASDGRSAARFLRTLEDVMTRPGDL